MDRMTLTGAIILQFCLTFYYIFFIIRPLSEIEKISGKINYGYRILIARTLAIGILDIINYEFSVCLDIALLCTLAFITTAPLIIGKIGFGATKHQEIDLVKQGDKILCYITTAPTKSYSYEIIDLQTESKIILSLEDYNLREVNDQKVGCILVGVMSILLLCLPIYNFAKSNKQKI